MSNESIEQDLSRVEDILLSSLTNSIYENSVNEMCLSTVKSGGKRIRPRLALLSWRALNADVHYDQILNFAASIELLHTATLVHDDVIDKATLRRGKMTINETEGNHIAVLAGDYLFTRSFFCIRDVDNIRLSSLLNSTLAYLVSGEISQLHNKGNTRISVADYEHTIYCKTGALFELATAGAAILENQEEAVINAFSEYGKQLGIAFQVTDDILDYTSSEKALGKNIGEDLLEGRITLPLIFALQKSEGDDKKALERAIADGDIDSAVAAIGRTGAIEMCHTYAREAVAKAHQALEIVRDSEYKSELKALAVKAADRIS